MSQEYEEVSIDRIPKDWRLVLLGEIGSTYNGLTGKSKDDFGKGEPYIPYMNIFSNNTINPRWLEYVNVSTNENQNQVKYGDIFFTTSSETPEEVGMSSVLLEDIGIAYLNSFCFGFRLNDFNTLMPEYAKFLFRGKDVRKSLVVYAQGSTRFNLSKTTLLKRLYLAIPPLPEQQKIADILTTVDDKLDNIECQIAEYTNLKTGLMQQLLTKGIGHTKFVESELGMIPEGWEVKSLSSLTSLMTNGFVGTATTFYTDEEDGIIYIQGYNVEEGKFRLNGIKRVSKEFHNKHLKSCLQTGDVLTIQTGDVGVSAVVNEELTGANCHALIISRPITNLLNSYFLSYFLNSQIGKTQIKSIQVGSTMLHINVSHFLKYKIPLPKLKEQQKIVEILSSVDDKIESLLQKKEEFTNMKKGLMEQLLTGRIRVKV